LAVKWTSSDQPSNNNRGTGRRLCGAHSLGFRVFADPAQTAADWILRGLGVDAIYSNIPLGVQLQPAIPNPLP